MSVVKNRSTAKSNEFWDHVESVAEQVRFKRESMSKPLTRDDTYLGDGLYASWDGYQIRLFAHNGYSATNEVFLDPDTLAAFERYVKELRKI